VVPPIRAGLPVLTMVDVSRAVGLFTEMYGADIVTPVGPNFFMGYNWWVDF